MHKGLGMDEVVEWLNVFKQEFETKYGPLTQDEKQLVDFEKFVTD